MAEAKRQDKRKAGPVEGDRSAAAPAEETSASTPGHPSDRVIELRLPDGKCLTLPAGSSVADVAACIGRRLARDAIAGLVDGRLVDLTHPLETDVSIEIITPGHPESLEILRHSTSHCLAQAVKELHPETKIAQGPSIEDGFYYDFDRATPFTDDDLREIERKMKEIVERDLPIQRVEMPKEEAIRFFEAEDEPYKLYFAREKGGPVVSTYRQKGFTDFCLGPHLPSTGRIAAFQLLSVAGAYWLGDEHNKMLQRIYGTAFFTEKELQEHLGRLEEARRRDHRVLGKQLELFMFDPVAPASPFFLPKGAIVYNLLVEFVREMYRKNGYQEVITPQIFESALWKRSGHYEHYKDNMFFTDVDEREFAVKPMNCPSHCIIYKAGRHSYRELPLRLADFGRLHRYERSGVTAGLTRVRSFAQDDAHIFLAPEMIGDEVSRFLAMTLESYGMFGLEGVELRLGTRPDDFIGDPAAWREAEAALAGALQQSGLEFTIEAGEGAFYGPKVDVMIHDVLKRPWQLGTVQLDFNFPERFDLHYSAADGTEKRPVMIHRAMLGSIERFLGILIEHCAGAFPFWLSPVQVRILPVTERAEAWATTVRESLNAEGLRAETDLRNEKIGAKIRQAQLDKVPYMLVVGDREVTGGTVSVRHRSEGDKGAVELDRFVDMAKRLDRSREVRP